MSRSRSPLTAEVEQRIVAFVRAGGWPHVAAEAAGVSRADFDNWMTRPGRRYRDFARAVRQAHAQARLRAEIAIFDDRPLDWLKSGPGKPQPDYPGWTGPAKAATTVENASPLSQPSVQELMTELIAAANDDPDLREKLASIAEKASAQCRRNDS